MQYEEEKQNVATSAETAESIQAENLVQLEQQLESEQRKAEEYLDLLRRMQADFMNYRKRVNQEQVENRVTAQISLLEQILPVLDDLGRALSATPPEISNQPWVQGINFVARRLMTLLEQLGVRQIGKQGEKFDPRLHEAVATGERSDIPEGTITQILRPGYMLGERVIRPAQVAVAGTSFPSGVSYTPDGSAG